jgi:hypothetical protein
MELQLEFYHYLYWTSCSWCSSVQEPELLQDHSSALNGERHSFIHLDNNPLVSMSQHLVQEDGHHTTATMQPLEPQNLSKGELSTKDDSATATNDPEEHQATVHIEVCM